MQWNFILNCTALQVIYILVVELLNFFGRESCLLIMGVIMLRASGLAILIAWLPV